MLSQCPVGNHSLSARSDNPVTCDFVVPCYIAIFGGFVGFVILQCTTGFVHKSKLLTITVNCTHPNMVYRNTESINWLGANTSPRNSVKISTQIHLAHVKELLITSSNKSILSHLFHGHNMNTATPIYTAYARPIQSMLSQTA